MTRHGLYDDSGGDMRIEGHKGHCTVCHGEAYEIYDYREALAALPLHVRRRYLFHEG